MLLLHVCTTVVIKYKTCFNFFILTILLLTDLPQIRSDVQTRLWFTYRKGFVQIGNTNFTSDRGWGCMLRCGQMVIGQALIFLNLGELTNSLIYGFKTKWFLLYCNL